MGVTFVATETRMTEPEPPPQHVILSANGDSTYPAKFANGQSSMDYYVSSTVPKINLPIPTRTAHEFLNTYSTNSNPTMGTQYHGTYTYNPSGPPTVYLYAAWALLPIKYVINFLPNGGTGAPSKTSITGEAGVAGGTVATQGTLARVGYTFGGWAWVQSTTTPAYTSGEAINTPFKGTGAPATPNLHGTTIINPPLYAFWIPCTYTFSYNANGGSGAASPASQNRTYNVSANIAAQNTLTNPGYTFGGWAWEAGDNRTAAYAASSPVSTWTQGQNGAPAEPPEDWIAGKTYPLYAVWTGFNYNMTFDANNGVIGGASKVTQSNRKYGNNSGSPALPIPTRAGYTFCGWAWSSTATVAAYAPGVALNTFTTEAGAGIADTPPTDNGQNYTMYAVWVGNSYTLSFNQGFAGTSPTSQPSITNCIYGTAVVLPANVFIRDGTDWAFSGWAWETETDPLYLAGSNLDTWIAGEDGAPQLPVPGATITLVAQWHPTQMAGLYYIFGGPGISISGFTRMYIPGGDDQVLKTIELPDGSFFNTYAPMGMEFECLYDNQELSGTAVTSFDVYGRDFGPYLFYIKWKPTD